jgi:hypothetical protein
MKITEPLLGTAREALENRSYNKLVDKYGKATAETLIEPQLQERGVTLEEFQTYRKVKRIVQNNGLNVRAAQKEAEELAKSAVEETF